jgi:ABC-type amino acid transport substrate-binding protein
MFKKGEERFKKLIDSKIAELKNNGSIKKLIKKYTGSEDTFIQ